MKATRVLVVVLRKPRTASGVLAYARGVYTMMNDNRHFASLTPLLGTFKQHVDELADAQAFTLTRFKGSKEARDEKALVVRQDLAQLCAQVRSLAGAQPAMAGEIVESAGMNVKRIGVRLKSAFSVRPGKVSGTVVIVAKAVAKTASYEWQYRLPDCVWNDAEPTLQAQTEISGLAIGTIYEFRFRALGRNGRGDYSQVVAILVA